MLVSSWLRGAPRSHEETSIVLPLPAEAQTSVTGPATA